MTASLAALDQALSDWVQYGNTASNDSTIRSLLGTVTYNRTYANTLQAGSGLDWFWETFAQDQVQTVDLLLHALRQRQGPLQDDEEHDRHYRHHRYQHPRQRRVLRQRRELL